MLLNFPEDGNHMKNKILQEALKWYEDQGEDSRVFIEDFIDLVIDKTADALFEEVKNELQNEFSKGTLKHPFIISGDYYLDLKLKEIREKCMKNSTIETLPEEE